MHVKLRGGNRGGPMWRLCQLFFLGHLTSCDNCFAAFCGAAERVWKCQLHLLVWGLVEVFSCYCNKTQHLKSLWSSSIIQTAVSMEAVRLLIFLFSFAKATEMILPWRYFSVSVKCYPFPLEHSNDKRCSFQQGLLDYFKLRQISLNCLRRHREWKGSSLYSPAMRPAVVFDRSDSFIFNCFVFLHCFWVSEKWHLCLISLLITLLIGNEYEFPAMN